MCIRDSQKAMANYLQQKAQYDFKDDVPKDILVIKMREGATEEDSKRIKFGLS